MAKVESGDPRNFQTTISSDPSDSDTVCDNVIARGASMPAPARAERIVAEDLSLEERIQQRAYELYILRGNESGSELDDWLQAEEEIQRAEDEARDESSRTWSPER
jgi:hypothetical protein